MLISYYWKTGISLSAWGCGWFFIKTIHKKVAHRLLASLCCRQLPAKEERLQPNILVRILFYSLQSMITFVLGFLCEEMRGHPKELSWFCGLRAPRGIGGRGTGTGWWHSPHSWIRRLFVSAWKRDFSVTTIVGGLCSGDSGLWGHSESVWTSMSMDHDCLRQGLYGWDGGREAVPPKAALHLA